MSITEDKKQTDYKDTPIGKIPADWEIIQLKSVIEELEAGVSVNSIDDEVSQTQPRVLKTSSVSGGAFFPHESKIIAPSDINKAKLNPRKDSIIISRMNTPDLVGETGFVERNYPTLFLPDRLWQTKFRSDNNSVYPKWLNFLLSSSEYKLKIKDIATGTSNSMKNISKQAFLNLKIHLPPLPEQKAIADCLSTWDRAIQLTEQLIRQKEQRKKWLMQNLLTGKMRLKGFSGEWKECKLGSLGDTYTGLTGKSKEDFGKGKPYIPYLNVFNNSRIDIKNLDYVKITEDDKQNKVKYGDIFFTVSSETPNEVGMASVILDEVDELYLNSFCFGFRLFDFNTLIPEFSSYLLRADTFRAKIYKLSQGATRFNLSKNNLMKLSIILPSKEEQTAIAEVLQAADKEIELHKAKAEQLKEQKKGLMQSLLTGKKRLVN